MSTRGAHARALAVISRWLEGSGFAVEVDAERLHLLATHPSRDRGIAVAVAGRSEYQLRIELKRPAAERLRETAATLGLDPFVGIVGLTAGGDYVAYLAPLWYVQGLPGDVHHQWHMTDDGRYAHEACVFVAHVRLREHPELL
jgi:hypothetical protein